MAKTKIIATLGPSSDSERVLKKMYQSGLDIVRLNFSHGKMPYHQRLIRLVRKLNSETGRKVEIMQDLEGYRIRVGDLPQPLILKPGDALYLSRGERLKRSGKVIPLDYQRPFTKIKPGTLIFIDDGKISLKVIETTSNLLKAVVLLGGKVYPHKGINIRGFDIPHKGLTAKDRADLKLGVREKVEYIAQSFVNSARDIKYLKRAVIKGHPRCRIFAKIESAKAISNIDGIIAQAAGIIIARGDLGVSLPIYEISSFQKQIIKKCRVGRKPVVVATQMLESMIKEPLPTRAEVSDVANAVLDGATHLMLSAETAIGKYPDKVVKMMKDIIDYTENQKSD